jgi:hypothetical protein
MEHLANAKTPEAVLQYLQDVSFPAKKDDIVHAARRRGAPNDIVAALGQLPRNEFDSPEQVVEAYPHIE